MSREHVDHSHIAKYATEKVNLPQDKGNTYRAQARGLREKVEAYIGEHPDFEIKKMIISGSLAKGTALRSINDIDNACYISGVTDSSDIPKLLDYLVSRLRKAFPNFTDDQVTPQTYSICVNFKGSGLNVDIVPILYNGDTDWFGNLVSQDDGSLLETNIPRHIEFIKKRKVVSEDFTQIIRLLKQWAKREKAQRNGFRFKSFMIEMILSKLVDEGQDLSDYPEALQSFFTYLAKSGLKERIVFEDYYKATEVGVLNEPVQILDPVNPKNNVARLYTQAQVSLIVDSALDAGDAIDGALSATSKQDTVYYWQKVFGPTFSA